MNRPAAMEELIRSMTRFGWCWDCGSTEESCAGAREFGRKCCPDCRHREESVLRVILDKPEPDPNDLEPGVRCGGPLGDLTHGPVEAVIAALRHVRLQTHRPLKMSSLEVALLTDSLTEQGAFTGPLRPPPPPPVPIMRTPDELKKGDRIRFWPGNESAPITEITTPRPMRHPIANPATHKILFENGGQTLAHADDLLEIVPPEATDA